MTIRVRFAPSPTGHLHVGGLRTALFNWLYARHNGGTFLVRIEDTDRERSLPEYTQSILESLAWCGLESDEPIVIQSERINEHRILADQLVSQGKAYRCYCTQEEIADRLRTMHGEDSAFISYDRHCLNNAHDSQKPFVIRFKVPDDIQDVSFDDLIRGTISVNKTEVDDFIIVRSDGTPMYNFVVVADDAFMKITHIIRGEDHISNTIKQILLYQACNFSLPLFGHLPMILGPSGDRLSKRDGAVSVIEYKKDGFLPEALLNYLARLGWSHGDQEIFTQSEMIEYFSLDAIGKKGAVFDIAKLLWVNGTHMRGLLHQQLLDQIVLHVMPDIVSHCSSWNSEILLTVVGLYKDRVDTLKKLAHKIIDLYDGPSQYNQQDVDTWITPQALHLLGEIKQLMQSAPEWDVDALQHDLKLLAKRHDVKLVTCAQPIRIALIGLSDGPGVFSLLQVIGKNESIRRIEKLLEERR